MIGRRKGPKHHHRAVETRDLPDTPGGLSGYVEGCSCGAHRKITARQVGGRDVVGPWILPPTRWKRAGEPGGWDLWWARSRRLGREIERRARSGLGIAYSVVVRVGPFVGARRIHY